MSQTAGEQTHLFLKQLYLKGRLQAHLWYFNCSDKSQVKKKNIVQTADRYTYNPISTRESNELWLKFNHHICQQFTVHTINMNCDPEGITQETQTYSTAEDYCYQFQNLS
jgi:hypothetical protein